jgi:hypothetical protein
MLHTIDTVIDFRLREPRTLQHIQREPRHSALLACLITNGESNPFFVAAH